MADRPSMLLLVTALILATFIIIFAMKYFTAARQARQQTMREEAYRDLAEKSVKAQEQNVAALAALKSSVSDIDTRLARVEKVLKEVE